MCGWSRAKIISRRAIVPGFLSTPSLIKKWLPPDSMVPAATSNQGRDAAMARNANSPMIPPQPSEPEAYRNHLSRTRHLHLPLQHQELGQEGVVTLHWEKFATIIGITVNAIRGSTAHSDTKRTPNHGLELLTLLEE